MDNEQAIHPYRAAWETRDLTGWAGALSPDVELWSPIIRKPFRGVTAATELFEVLFGIFSEFRITREFQDGDVAAFFWNGKVGGRVIEGTDLITTDERGKISEIRVLIRPLVDIATFAAAIGPAVARRRGRVRGVIAMVLVAPLRPLLTAVDLVATRLAQGGAPADRD